MSAVILPSECFSGTLQPNCYSKIYFIKPLIPLEPVISIYLSIKYFQEFYHPLTFEEYKGRTFFFKKNVLCIVT